MKFTPTGTGMFSVREPVSKCVDQKYVDFMNVSELVPRDPFYVE